MLGPCSADCITGSQQGVSQKPLLAPSSSHSYSHKPICLDERGASRLYIGVLFANLYAARKVNVHVHVVKLAVPRGLFVLVRRGLDLEFCWAKIARPSNNF
jgi:hypothetical protein